MIRVINEKDYLKEPKDCGYMSYHLIVEVPVELIKEKPAYTKAGVKVGDFGAIMSEKPVNGKWQVVFSEFYTGKDIADIMVVEEDLKVHDSVPKDRYPKK